MTGSCATVLEYSRVRSCELLAQRVALWPRCAELGRVIWLVAIWVAVVALWGVSEPGMSAAAMNRLARDLRARWRAGVAHPFDWAKD
jgi:hypothetical protein